MENDAGIHSRAAAPAAGALQPQAGWPEVDWDLLSWKGEFDSICRDDSGKE